ncbi:MAG: ferrous iron transport protein B [Thermoguttaceae bacterium]|nr:ferrous iron transport protein B [Thermoguttaceae bacterium]MDW8038019.1 ferrous iron transport protein B [Thermoguttaceae bacterium]
MASEKLSPPLTIALLGNPNTGKSTLFTALVGVHQRVGNYPGVTVEKKIGSFVYQGRRFEVVDLPGLYSLSPRSRDEAIAVEVLLGRSPGTPAPDGVILIVDATNLERNLYLVSQVLEFGLPTVVALNMIDLAQRRGIQIEIAELERRLGVPVVPTQAHRRQGIEQLQAALAQSIAEGIRPRTSPLPECFWEEVDRLDQALKHRQLSRLLVARILLDPGGFLEKVFLPDMNSSEVVALAEAKHRLAQADLLLPDLEPAVRYQWIEKILQGLVHCPLQERPTFSERIDRLLTHPVCGFLVFVGVMLIIFQAVYAWAEAPMGWIEAGVQGVAEWLHASLPPGPLRSLLVEGLCGGVGSVLAFLPQILILFFFIGLLEDSGYMARTAYLMDRWMCGVGLSGKSVIPLLSSVACAVPGIMATRVIEDPRARLTTILIAPLMTCSARLPVYVMLISAFVPPQTYLGGLLNLQGLVLAAMYLIGMSMAGLVAWLIKRWILLGPTSSFVMELPSYKIPSLRTVLYRVFERGWIFLQYAGTIILAVSILVWALLHYPRSAEVETPFLGQAQQLAEQLHRWFQEVRPHCPGQLQERLQRVALVADQLKAPQSPLLYLVEHLRDELQQWNSFAQEGTDEPAGAPAPPLLAPTSDTFGQLQQQTEQFRLDLLAAYQRQSLLGRLGRRLEPIFRPLGWDWRITMAVLASFPAREVVVATLGVLFQAGPIDPENPEQLIRLHQRLQSATWEGSEEKLFNLPVALGLMVFYTLCAQCAATLLTIRQETLSWRWPIFVFSYMTALAYLGALATYQLASRLLSF